MESRKKIGKNWEKFGTKQFEVAFKGSTALGQDILVTAEPWIVC